MTSPWKRCPPDKGKGCNHITCFYEQGRDDATAAIVAWLRALKERTYADAFADRIERGEHLRSQLAPEQSQEMNRSESPNSSRPVACDTPHCVLQLGHGEPCAPVEPRHERCYGEGCPWCLAHDSAVPGPTTEPVGVTGKAPAGAVDSARPTESKWKCNTCRDSKHGCWLCGYKEPARPIACDTPHCVLQLGHAEPCAPVEPVRSEGFGGGDDAATDAFRKLTEEKVAARSMRPAGSATSPKGGQE